MGVYPEPHEWYTRSFCLTDACEEICSYTRYLRIEYRDVIHIVHIAYPDGSEESFRVTVQDNRYKDMDYREITLDIIERSI
jgi:hypothetical protein